MRSSRPLKILIARNSAGAIGGAELSAADQAVALLNLGHRPLLVSGLRRLRRQLPAGVRTYGWLRFDSRSRLRKAVAWPLVFIEAAFYGLWLKPDVINPHSREDQVAFTLTKWLHRRPVVWKNAGDLRYQLLPVRGNFGRQLSQRLLKRAIARADHIYSLNQQDSDYLLKNVPGLDASQLSAIPAGILFANFDLGSRLESQGSSLIIGTAIQLHRHKGVQDLIQAFKSLPASLGQLELWLVGAGDDKLEMEQLAADDKRVKFFGHQPDISPFLAAIDIFVQPAHKEAWGRNIVEAMYFGKAIIGSRTHGLAQQVEDGQTGLLFEPGDSRELAGLITRLVRDKALRQRLGKAAAAKAKARGDFQTIVSQQILPLYMAVVRGKSK